MLWRLRGLLPGTWLGRMTSCAQLACRRTSRSRPRATPAPHLPASPRPQVGRTKHILSANTEAPISVEELFEDRDFRSTITREKFEELAGQCMHSSSAGASTKQETTGPFAERG